MTIISGPALAVRWAGVVSAVVLAAVSVEAVLGAEALRSAAEQVVNGERYAHLRFKIFDLRFRI